MKKRLVVASVFFLIVFSFFVSAVLNVTSPQDNTWNNSREILFNVSTSDTSDFFYIDDISKSDRWNKLCSAVKSCERIARLDEGKNNITIKAVNLEKKEINYSENIIINIDSKYPVIRKVGPRGGFATGLFEIEFREENPKNLTLEYNNNKKSLDIVGNCTDVDRKKDTKNCIINISSELQSYNWKEIKYRFLLEDYAGNIAISDFLYLPVDTTKPNCSYSAYTQDKRKITFVFDKIIEENFKEITYTDNNERTPKSKKLCDRLINGRCVVTKIFSRGEHNLTTEIFDQADNKDIVKDNIIFNVI